MKKNVLLAAIIVFISFSYSDISAQKVQSVGKIYDQDVANVFLGRVFFSFPIDKEVFQKIMADTTGYVMFRVKKDGWIVLNRYRKVIYPDGAQVGDEEPCFVFSIDKLQELLDRSKTGTVTLEMRGGTATLYSDGIDLDQSWLCPPVCP